MTDDRDDDFLLKQDRQFALASVQAKAERGDRLDHRERVMLASDDCARLDAKIKREMRQVRFANGKDHAVRYTQGNHDAIHRAVSLLISALAAERIARIEEREKLEDRIAVLEGKTAAAKPDEAVPRVRLVL